MPGGGGDRLRRGRPDCPAGLAVVARLAPVRSSRAGRSGFCAGRVDLGRSTGPDCQRSSRGKRGRSCWSILGHLVWSPCVALLPHTVELYDRFHRAGLAVITVSLDEPEERLAVLKFLVDCRAATERLSGPLWRRFRGGVAFGRRRDAAARPALRSPRPARPLVQRHIPADGGLAGPWKICWKGLSPETSTPVCRVRKRTTNGRAWCVSRPLRNCWERTGRLGPQVLGCVKRTTNGRACAVRFTHPTELRCQTLTPLRQAPSRRLRVTGKLPIHSQPGPQFLEQPGIGVAGRMDVFGLGDELHLVVAADRRARRRRSRTRADPRRRRSAACARRTGFPGERPD